MSRGIRLVDDAANHRQEGKLVGFAELVRLQRVRQIDADPLVVGEVIASRRIEGRKLEMSDRVRGRQQLEAVEVGEQVLSDQPSLSGRAAPRFRLERLLRRAEQKCSRADGGVEHGDCFIRKPAVQAERFSQHGIGGAHEIFDKGGRRVVDASPASLARVVLLQKALVEVDHQIVFEPACRDLLADRLDVRVIEKSNQVLDKICDRPRKHVGLGEEPHRALEKRDRLRKILDRPLECELGLIVAETREEETVGDRLRERIRERIFVEVADQRLPVEGVDPS